MNTMNIYTESEKKLSVREYDVLVAGGGPSGFSAAYTAARLGASVLLCEQLGDIGGMSTSGLMSHWTGSVSSLLYRELLRRSAQAEGRTDVGGIYINPEILKAVYFSMLDEVGCNISLYTFVSDVIISGENVKGIITESKSGREAIFAKVLIDATGDGDVAAKAGVPFTKGRDGDGKMQPATLMFKVGGVDTDRAVLSPSFETRLQTPDGELQALARKELPYPAGHVLLYATTVPGVITCNMTNCVDTDGTYTADLTKAMKVCRSQINDIVKFLRRHAPGYEGCFQISSASLIGIRETRHFKGLYTLTEEDILSARVFEDAVVFDARFNFDVHNLTGPGLDDTGVQKKFPKCGGYTIPYRCLIPVNREGLLLCGRNISGTHIAHSDFRVMPICVAIGEAAGAAAYTAQKQGCSIRDVKTEEILKGVKAQSFR